MIQLYKKALERSLTYPEYREFINSLLEEGKTTGPDQSEKMIYYTDLNVQRMNKWDKHFRIEPDVEQAIGEMDPEIWLVLTEAWCGDAAHSIPVMAALADLNHEVDLRLVWRDENPELMDHYLTNGGKSIPKLIRLDPDTLEERGHWGPRPAEAQDLFLQLRAEGVAHDEYVKALQVWYARNKGRDIQREIAALVKGS